MAAPGGGGGRHDIGGEITRGGVKVDVEFNYFDLCSMLCREGVRSTLVNLGGQDVHWAKRLCRVILYVQPILKLQGSGQET